MRTGHIFMGIGLLAAVLGQNPDAYMAGILFGIAGLFLLNVKGI